MFNNNGLRFKSRCVIVIDGLLPVYFILDWVIHDFDIWPFLLPIMPYYLSKLKFS